MGERLHVQIKYFSFSLTKTNATLHELDNPEFPFTSVTAFCRGLELPDDCINCLLDFAGVVASISCRWVKAKPSSKCHLSRSEFSFSVGDNDYLLCVSNGICKGYGSLVSGNGKYVGCWCLGDLNYTALWTPHQFNLFKHSLDRCWAGPP